jgi:hypothetical protein
MSHEEMNEVPVTVAEMTTVPSNPEVISNFDPSFVTRCLAALNIGVSSFTKWCEHTLLFMKEMVFALNDAVYIVTHKLCAFLYNCIYSLTLYWLMHAPTGLPFFPGYEGMDQREVCGRLMNIRVTNFLNDENLSICEEKIDGVVTGRTTIIIYCLACVLSTLFVMFYVPRMAQLFLYLWSYKDRIRQEEYEREERREADEERRKADEELAAKKAADSVERKLNNAKNKVMKTVISKIFGIIGMNDHESRNKVVEIRNILDCLHNKEGEHYRRAAQELQWDKKDWILSGNPRVTTNIVGLLENIDNYEGETSYEDEEEDDDN